MIREPADTARVNLHPLPDVLFLVAEAPVPHCTADKRAGEAGSLFPWQRHDEDGPDGRAVGLMSASVYKEDSLKACGFQAALKRSAGNGSWERVIRRTAGELEGQETVCGRLL